MRQRLLSKTTTLLFVMLLLTPAVCLAGNVTLVAQNVDDYMQIYIDGNEVANCTWSSNPGCQAAWQGSMEGRHEIRFKLTNYVYNGLCLIRPCGKWSADMAIGLGDKILWSNGVFAKENDPDVKYDVTLVCDFEHALCVEK